MIADVSKRALVLLLALLLVVSFAFLATLASHEYLKSHHDTAIASWIELLAPPPDLYTPVAKRTVRDGDTDRSQIEHRYPGKYMVAARIGASDPSAAVTGRLDCGLFTSLFRNRGRVFDSDGEGVAIAYYVVDEDLVGRTLQCEILVGIEGNEGDVVIEIARLSSL